MTCGLRIFARGLCRIKNAEDDMMRNQLRSFLLLLVSFLTSATHLPAQTGWVQQTSGTTAILMRVQFIGRDTGKVLGFNGTFLRTTNGGTNWIVDSTGVRAFYYGMSFLNANLGLVVGSYGLILRTTDGGLTWDSIPSPTEEFLHAVQFAGSGIAIAVGTTGTIIRSTRRADMDGTAGDNI